MVRPSKTTAEGWGLRPCATRRSARRSWTMASKQPAAIQRITVAHPSEVTPYVIASSEDMAAGPDDMTQDEHGNLYLAANGAGEVWKIDTQRRICVLARGLMNASAVSFGTGRYARNLYVSTFTGLIVELRNVRPKPSRSPRHDRASGRRCVRCPRPR